MRWLLFILLAAGCEAPPTGATRIFDPCDRIAVAAPGATDAELASLDGALAMWRDRGAPGLVRDDAAEVVVTFRPAAAAIYGFYDDAAATVYINTAVTDPTQREITIAHEVGHALGLVHVSPDVRSSVMNPGNLTVVPADGDQTALADLWGTCGVAPQN